MKKAIVIIILYLTASINLDAGLRDRIDFNYFYHTLSPYGEWISLDAELIVWRPNSVHASWQPYSVGRWSWTNHGWYWDSFEPFGWATYHYGRWIYDNYYGWLWLPDYEWGPAWVEWRYDDVYIGWAPLPPYASFSVNFGIHFSLNWSSPYRHWHFVRYNHFCHPDVHYYFIDHRDVNRFFGRTKYRTNYYADRDRIFNGGVDKRLVERRAGYRIAEREIQRTSDFEDYRRSRKDNSGIRTFVPDERELKKYEADSEVRVNRGDRATDIRKDKILLRNSEVSSARDEFDNPGAIEKRDVSEKRINLPERRDVQQDEKNIIRRNEQGSREESTRIERRGIERKSSEPKFRKTEKSKSENSPKPQSKNNSTGRREVKSNSRNR